MPIEIIEVGIGSLKEYAQVSIAFEVHSMYQVLELEGGLQGLQLKKKDVSPPYIKDFDSIPREGPLSWPKQFDLKGAGIFLAQGEGNIRGAAAVFLHNPKIRMLEGRKDLAVLWDIRVDNGFRGLGIGSSLFLYAAHWAKVKGCTLLKVETQNINVDAIHFYKKMGCRLGIIHRYAYPKYPEEVMLVWYLDL